VHRIDVDTGSSVSVVAAEGELDAFVEPDLAAAFEQVRDDSLVLVDLGAVGFMDSTALGLVVRFVREHGERGGDARVVLPRGTARRIFELTMLDRALPVSAAREAALSELGGRT
jgi:anti-anti-sigma factor